jgi:hypothetical protein
MLRKSSGRTTAKLMLVGRRVEGALSAMIGEHPLRRGDANGGVITTVPRKESNSVIPHTLTPERREQMRKNTNVKFRPSTGPSLRWGSVSCRNPFSRGSKVCAVVTANSAPKKGRRDGSSRRHEGLGLLPLKGERWADGDAGLVRWKRGWRGQAGSAISRDRSSLLIALFRRRSDTRA